MQHQELIPHLFRTEFGKINAVLINYFGIKNLELAEDITSETFLAALESWPYNGIPDNPKAWLYTVARNKTKNYLQRNKIFQEKISKELLPEEPSEPEIDLSEKNISDSLLQMLFVICDPSLPAEAQIGLALRTLCGFGVEEIATAFVTSKETINKRLFRARKKLREEQPTLDFASIQGINSRLDAVLATLYLLFSEGYYSETNQELIREDLCKEAMRLTFLLLENERTDQPRVNALYALMCFHASRFPARKNSKGEMILYEEQDKDLWNQELIANGGYYLNKASVGTGLSPYHVEASIAYWYTVKSDSAEKWQNILQLYNVLLQMEYSPIAALNRAYAFSKVKGNAAAIEEVEKLKLTGNHFYFLLLAELYKVMDTKKKQKHIWKTPYSSREMNVKSGT
jgi:RNA polymerase sigma-70 factor (ECF subfamily)